MSSIQSLSKLHLLLNVRAISTPDGRFSYCVYCFYSFIKGESVISSCSTHQMQSCNHEEADTRILVHVKDALDKGCRSVLVRTVDTDVVVILISQFHKLSSTRPGSSFWVAFGMGKNFKLLSVNSICEHLGEQKCHALPFFHAFTGCDTTSAFLGKGKKSAWEAWNAYPEATAAFSYTNKNPFHSLEINDPLFNVLQRFVVVLYDRTSLATDVNSARRELFTKKNRALENIPPTEVRTHHAETLLLHLFWSILNISKLRKTMKQTPRQY